MTSYSAFESYWPPCKLYPGSPRLTFHHPPSLSLPEQLQHAPLPEQVVHLSVKKAQNPIQCERTLVHINYNQQHP